MKKQILIVDDEVSILKLLTFVLSKQYTLIIKNSGVEAIAWLEEGNDPDLIISDWHMPYFDGSSFLRNLKISGFYRDTPVLVLSGADDLKSTLTNLPFKVDGYIQKPFNPDDLKSTITKVLEEYDTASN